MRFLEINDSDFKLDEVQSYAYLWSLTIHVNWLLANWNLVNVPIVNAK
jgi:hypothetical protein